MKTETKRILGKAQAGDAEAQYLTGLYYEDKENIDEAFLWYERSATQGFVYGINAVAVYYLKGMAVERDTGKAIALLESIAEELPTAKANLGHIYLEGQGCPQDIGKGIGLLGQAADSGDGLSAFTMGQIRLKGLFGTPVMYKEATGWFEKAYELGIYDSVDFLCDLYEGLYSRGMRDIRKYRLWSDVRKSLEKVPCTGPAMPSSSNVGNVPVFGEANGRQYIIISGEKAYVDLLVAETFLVNPDPDVYTEVEHVDGNMFNNAASNLRWIKKRNKVYGKEYESNIDRKD